MNYRHLFTFLFLLGNYVLKVETFEPVTTGALAMLGVGLIGSGLWSITCKFRECCDDGWVHFNATGLRYDLERQLHGQHLVKNSVIKSLKGHFNNPHPDKALVLSFHGWTGSGKNFVSRIIANNIFENGMKSGFVHLFIATHHFPHADETEVYKDQLRDWIASNVSACARSVFIFDEMDKMPTGLIDAIKPFIDHYEDINGINYRKTIFIFLSNTGGVSIAKKTLDNWRQAKKREDLELKDFEPNVTLGAFNEAGGLWHSSLIEKNLISLFVPFLPLEREHVKLCIRDDLLSKNQSVTDELINSVADTLQYEPQDNPIFSKSGCKRVSQKVDFMIEDYL